MRFSYNVGFGKQSITPGIKWIMIITGVCYLIELISPDFTLWWFRLNPAGSNEAGTVSNFQIWQPITYMFLHNPGSFLHILFNMFALWMFGISYERQFGTKDFLKLYFISGIGTGIILSFFLTNVLGASAAVFAVLVSFAYMWPNAQVLLMFVIPVRAKTAVIVFIVLELFFTIQTAKSNIAHSGHLLGALIGFIYLQAVHKRYNLFSSFFTWYHNLFYKTKSSVKAKSKAKIIKKEQWTKDKVNLLLEKISKHGISSLTKEEKDFLDRVSSEYKSDSYKSDLD